ncbi:hypothetical protein DFJ63DRAFT_314675 [Scheffersomyces coipomensis]|uniref:uncharacterized protein n=1 Tax=Scheffersomyces coipomensis TaxID=1788519 RepID=UPI00315D5C3F
MFKSYISRIGQSIIRSTNNLSTTTITSSSSASAAAVASSIVNTSTSSSNAATSNNNTAATQKPLITIYHNSNSLLSSNLFSKLNHYSDLPNKFSIDLKLNQSLSNQDYDFIKDECVDIHPDNRSILMQIMNIKHDQKQNMVQNFHQLPESPNFNNNNNKNISLIIDYKNKLIANDEASFDRIMVNYLSCGIQNFQRTKPVSNYSSFMNNNGNNNKNDKNQNNSYMTAQSNNSTTSSTTSSSTLPSIHQNLVHPHIAEFADLF